jgi:hypothetical protein
MIFSCYVGISDVIASDLSWSFLIGSLFSNKSFSLSIFLDNALAIIFSLYLFLLNYIPQFQQFSYTFILKYKSFVLKDISSSHDHS